MELLSGCHVQRLSRGHEQRPKLGIFIDVQGATNVESLLKGAKAHEYLRTTALSDTDKSFSLIPQSGGEQQGNSSRNFQNHVQLLVQLNISAGCIPAC